MFCLRQLWLWQNLLCLHWLKKFCRNGGPRWAKRQPPHLGTELCKCRLAVICLFQAAFAEPGTNRPCHSLSLLLRHRENLNGRRALDDAVAQENIFAARDQLHGFKLDTVRRCQRCQLHPRSYLRRITSEDTNMPKIGDSELNRRTQPGKKAMGLGFKKPCSLGCRSCHLFWWSRLGLHGIFGAF